ncbi:MAG: phosphoenolpyruvate--protein phosphotransferase [Peptostreptococcaceae bacterium]|nr:phosphoenolpyruvate--protein phosphotransferase [Peptostreptococcaceae bacterium]
MYKGIPASEGIAIGKVLKLEKENPIIDKKQISDREIDEQKNQLTQAVELSKKQLQEIQETSGEVMSAILDAHLMMLEDIELLGMIHSKIENEHQDVVSATDDSVQFFADMLESLEDEYMKERAGDMRDIGYRLIMNLLGKEILSLSTLKEPVIIVADDITPSDTAQMNKNTVLGFLTNVGGRTSHSAIMARTLEIPAIVGLGDISRKVASGDIVCFDGEEGIVFVHPNEEQLQEFQHRKEIYEQKKLLLEQYRNKESITPDGHRVEIAANIGHPKDVNAVNRNGAEGIGLYRTEFLYMDRESMPTEEEQFDAYKSVLEEMQNKPVVIRTLDIGGDKKLPYLPLSEEMNPFLGYRAIRICLDQQEIFKTQLRALLRASVYGNLKIMYPMISSLEEVRLANAVLEDCKKELESEGISYAKFEVGVMIEIPSAALSADLIASEVDFFSIGTNDLIQYTCAVDRMNEKISSLYNPFHPALLRLIKQVIETAHEHDIWCGICGETAADKRLIPLYLGMGLDEFSMSAGSIPKARKQIAHLSTAEAKQMLAEVLKMKTSAEIEAYMNEKTQEI